MSVQQTAIPAPDETVEAAFDLISREAVSLYPQMFDGDGKRVSLLTSLRKSHGDKDGEASKQATSLGRKEHPFDYATVLGLQTVNEHHAACIDAKVASTVGLGHRTDETEQPVAGGEARPKEERELSKVDRVLNVLCTDSWQDTLGAVCEDYWQVGQGYIEVVRRSTSRTVSSPGATTRAQAGDITGLHHLSAPSVWLFLENDLYDFHYEILSDESATTKRFARFNDKEGLIRRARSAPQTTNSNFQLDDNADRISEVIRFRRPTSLARWYGFPDWLAAVATIEIVQCLNQHKFDYFLNRGVPEFMLFITGQKLPADDWKKITAALKANIGLGNSHKSMAVNLTNENVKIQLEKLAMESKGEDPYRELKETLGTSVVTAHGVPPLLAGILIPGKLGATNELPNAIQAFQLLKIGRAQRVFEQTLGCTLAGKNSTLGLVETDFKLRKITDEIDLAAMDTQSRMREPAAGGRDPKEGLKD